MSQSLQVCQIKSFQETHREEHLRYIDQAFQLWSNVWSQTFSSLDGKSSLQSDDFTRQDEILGLWFQNRCIALVCHRFVNLNLSFNRMDSYFQFWPQHCLDEIIRNSSGPRIAIGSQITIHPQFRKTGSIKIDGALDVKRVISYLSFHSLSRNSNIDAVCGTMRSDKGMNQLFYQSGAKALAKNLTLHNVPVDLVAFYNRTPGSLSIPDEYRPIIRNLWEQKISIFPPNPVRKDLEYAA